MLAVVFRTGMPQEHYALSRVPMSLLFVCRSWPGFKHRLPKVCKSAAMFFSVVFRCYEPPKTLTSMETPPFCFAYVIL